MKQIKKAKKDETGNDKFVVRLPHGIRPRIANSARLARRSMNAEIILRLENSLKLTEKVKEEEPSQKKLEHFYGNIPPKNRDSDLQYEQLFDLILKLPHVKQQALMALLSEDYEVTERKISSKAKTKA